jgi:hypothetical protein
MEFTNIAYVVGAVCFILGIKMLSHPRTARKGNAITSLGMLIAIVATLIVAKITAINPSHDPNPPPTFVAIIAPTMAMPEMAFDPDINGVCNVGGTLFMISFPTITARINTVKISIMLQLPMLLSFVHL